MADNGYTKGYADGAALTESQLDSAYKSLKLDISNTTQLTNGSTSGTFLKSNGDGVAASFASVPDPLGPFAIRNYGLSTSASAGAMTVALKTNANADASTSDKINIPFSANGTTSATYTALDVTAALSFTITASATLGFTGTSANRVFVYAINNGGTPKLAVSARSDLDAGAAVSTTAIGSSADSASVLYATAALTVVPRLLGWFEAAMNSSKQWQTATKVNVTNNANLTNTATANQTFGAITTTNTTLSNLVIDGYTRTSGTAAQGVRGVCISPSSSGFNTSSSSFVAVTNLSATLTTSGRPVFVTLSPATDDGSATNEGSILTTGSNPTYEARYKRGTSALCLFSPPLLAGVGIPGGAFSFIDVPTAGTHTYTFEVKLAAGTKILVEALKLVVFEL